MLINNAAIVHTGWARDVPISGHHDTIQTNCLGTINGMLTALPRFRQQGAGHLITVASMVAFVPYPGLASYAAAKHALRAFHVALAIEETRAPAAFTLVYPGATDSPLLDKESKDDALAFAFAGDTCSTQDLARSIIDAITNPAGGNLPATQEG